MKACPATRVLREMRAAGIWIDAVSGNEALRARRAGFAAGHTPPEICFTADVFRDNALQVVLENGLLPNLGSPGMVRDLAKAVVQSIPGCSLSINESAPADSRSYQVDFSRFAALAPGHQPQMALADSISDLVTGLRSLGFADPEFRNSPLIRLQVLKQLIAEGLLSENLTWNDRQAVPDPVQSDPIPMKEAVR